jgi:two-component system response regulator FixJ
MRSEVYGKPSSIRFPWELDKAIRPMNPNAAIIFVIEGDESARDNIRTWIESAGYETEVFASPREFTIRGRHHGIGCVLADLALAVQCSFDLQNHLNTCGSSLPLVFMAREITVPLVVDAIKSGAIDFLQKPVDKDLLMRAVKEGLERSQEAWLRIRETEEIKRRAAFLTPREMEVFKAVVSGSLNKQIAFHFGTVEKTIKVHRGRVMKKMQAQSLVDLVHMSEKLGVSSAEGTTHSPIRTSESVPVRKTAETGG